jgi:hypothetical protein
MNYSGGRKCDATQAIGRRSRRQGLAATGGIRLPTFVFARPQQKKPDFERCRVPQ